MNFRASFFSSLFLSSLTLYALLLLSLSLPLSLSFSWSRGSLLLQLYFHLFFSLFLPFRVHISIDSFHSRRSFRVCFPFLFLHGLLDFMAAGHARWCLTVFLRFHSCSCIRGRTNLSRNPKCMRGRKKGTSTRKEERERGRKDEGRGEGRDDAGRNAA